jgi:hypothetical protein
MAFIAQRVGDSLLGSLAGRCPRRSVRTGRPLRGIRMPITLLPGPPGRWLRNVNHKRPVVTKEGLDRRRILPKSPLVEAVRLESQGRLES